MKVRIRRAWKPSNDGPGTRPWYVEIVMPGKAPHFVTMQRTHRHAIETASELIRTLWPAAGA